MNDSQTPSSPTEIFNKMSTDYQVLVLGGSDYEYFSTGKNNSRSLSSTINSTDASALSLQLLEADISRTAVPEEVSTDFNVPYTIFEILVAIVAIVGNLMVIIVFQRDRKLRRRTNYYIVSLAMADFLVGLLGVPFAILASVGLPTNLHACLFTVSLLVVLCTISIFCLVAVSVDRYWAILHPMAYSRNVRTKTAIGIISMCWFAGSIVGFLPLFGWHAGDVMQQQACLFVKVMDYNYLVFLYFATIITPALLLLAFYAHIYRVIIRQVRQIVTMKPVGGDNSRRSSIAQIQAVAPNRAHGGTMLRVLGAARKREVKATQNLSIIVLFFMICWIPLYTINCVKAFCPHCFVHPKWTLFCIILSHLNSAVNPVLYAYHLKDFRAALKNLILKILGMEIEPPTDLNYRLSLASQQRLQSVIDKRTSVQNRIYIDSPVWLRQQQQLASAKTSTISCSLNSVHHTMAAVASATADVKRDIWQITEVNSGAEETSRCHGIENAIESANPNENCRSIEKSSTSISEKDCSYDNKDFSTSFNDLIDNEVSTSVPKSSHATNAISSKDSELTTAYLQKLKNDLDQFNSFHKEIPFSDSFSDYDDANLMILKTSNVPVANDASISENSPAHPKQPSVHSDSGSNTSLNHFHHRNSVFVVENDKNLLSPEHTTRIRKNSQRKMPTSPYSAHRIPTGRIQRSCSCSINCGLGNESELADGKMSPFKVRSGYYIQKRTHCIR